MWAIVPFKGVPSGKSRLAEHLSVDDRATCAFAMLRDVLTALSNAPSLDGIILSSPMPELPDLSEFNNLTVYQDHAQSLAEAVTEASDFAKRELSASSTFIVPADIPMIQSADVEKAISAHDRATIIPDANDVGTNGLLCTPPNAFRYVFDGRSFRPHMRAAQEAGLNPQPLRVANFALDVDTIADLKKVVALAPNSHTARSLIEFQGFESKHQPIS